MSLTRAMLKGMSLTDEQVSAIIEEHTSVTSALKEQIKQYKEDAEKLPEVQKELDELKKDTSANDWKEKYEKEHKAFEEYKTDVTTKETTAKIKSAYKSLLVNSKVKDDCIDSILKVTDFSEMKLDEDGNIVDADKLTEAIKNNWSGFIVKQEVKPSGVETPPGGDDGKAKSTRAAERAALYHKNLYGEAKEGN